MAAITKSRREDVLAAVVTALGAATATPLTGTQTAYDKPTELTVGRNPESDHDDSQLPRVDVYQGPEGATYEVTDGATLVMTVRLRTEIKWDPNSDGSGDEALDEYLSWNVIAVMADITLSGTASDVKYTGMQAPLAEKRADRYAMALQNFEITYLTKAGNPLEGY